MKTLIIDAGLVLIGFLIGRFSALIRRVMLRNIKREAESRSFVA